MMLNRSFVISMVLWIACAAVVAVWLSLVLQVASM